VSNHQRQFKLSVLVLLISISVLATLAIVPPTFPQENALFSASPGSFTASKVPPLGTPYVIPQTIVVRNNDNIERVVLITSEKPPENETTPGYVPIPNENWIIPLPSSVLIGPDNFAVIKLSFDIPRDENLTGQKWEVWIPVEREPNPGEIGVLTPTVRVKIETTSTLPAPGKSVSTNILIVIIVVVIVIILISAWFWARGRGAGKPRRATSSRK
jgi:hypothetical protein